MVMYFLWLLVFISTNLGFYPAIPQAKTRQNLNQITLALIKPDAVKALYTGEIISLIEKNKFDILYLKKLCLTKEQAESFYKEHKDKPFFAELVQYMTSGPIIALALEKENAIESWRTLMGATNPEKAGVGTIRYMFGTNLTFNAVHGSDSQASAERELSFFFRSSNNSTKV
ncbi:MAG TPA: nucleoside-diphosphate kinase [Candidatus Babeliaceae bacterium]|nr:nucleoside-diphosphate kinase [Candidatus Babeliaceae bacterium]